MEQQKYFADLERLAHGESIVGLVSGYQYAIYRTHLGHLCGYVEMTGKKIDIESIDCHGGVTYDCDSETTKAAIGLVQLQRKVKEITNGNTL